MKPMPRLTGWLFLTIMLMGLIAWIAPHQIQVTAYKVSLVTLGGVIGYWMSRAVVKMRMDSILVAGQYTLAAALLIYRGVCVGCGMLALSLGS